MKKIILVPLCAILISSCTLPFASDTSFEGLYKANIHAKMTSVASFGEKIGLSRHESVEGGIASHVTVPSLFTGSVTAQYASTIDGRNSESYIRNIDILAQSMMGGGSAKIDELGYIGVGAENFISFKNILVSSEKVLPPETLAILKKYEGMWLDASQSSLSGSLNPDEEASYRIAKNLFALSLSDIEKYATEYPVWKNTADLGMSGSLHTWRVELDRAQILSLVQKLALDLSGKAMETDTRTALEQKLNTIGFSGTLGFDPKDPTISRIDGTITDSGSVVGDILLSSEAHGYTLRVSNPEIASVLNISLQEKDNRVTLDAGVTQSGVDMGNATGYIETLDNKFHELSLSLSSQGMTATLKHAVSGGSFSGSLSAVVGTIQWSGESRADQLASLRVDGQSAFLGKINLDLKQTGSDLMIRGPLTVTSNDKTLLNANIGLLSMKERFSFVMDLVSEAMPVHFDFDITAKSAPSTKKIVAPKSTQSLQKVIQEINALAPFSEQVSPEQK